VKDIADARDLNDEQRKRVLYQNAVDFFALKDLPRPRALSIARASWESGKRAAG
jgi:hypothetical protein